MLDWLWRMPFSGDDAFVASWEERHRETPLPSWLSVPPLNDGEHLPEHLRAPAKEQSRDR